MKVVVQRVESASVKVDGKILGQIDNGYLLLVGFGQEDTEEKIDYVVKKIISLRIFSDQNGKMNLNIGQVGGKILSISQFTLYANTKDGARPSFTESLKFDEANKYYQLFNQKLRSQGLIVEEGEFGADMKVSLVNDGPVTIIVEN